MTAEPVPGESTYCSPSEFRRLAEPAPPLEPGIPEPDHSEADVLDRFRAWLQGRFLNRRKV